MPETENRRRRSQRLATKGSCQNEDDAAATPSTDSAQPSTSTRQAGKRQVAAIAKSGYGPHETAAGEASCSRWASRLRAPGCSGGDVRLKASQPSGSKCLQASQHAKHDIRMTGPHRKRLKADLQSVVPDSVGGSSGPCTPSPPTSTGYIGAGGRDSAGTPDYLSERLPNEVILRVMQYMDEREVLRLGTTCRRLHTLANDPHLWKTKYLSVFPFRLPLTTSVTESGRLRYALDEDGCEDGAWKTCYKKFFNSVHVDPEPKCRNTRIRFFETIESCVSKLLQDEQPHSQKTTVIILHEGVHEVRETVVVHASWHFLGTCGVGQRAGRVTEVVSSLRSVFKFTCGSEDGGLQSAAAGQSPHSPPHQDSHHHPAAMTPSPHLDPHLAYITIRVKPFSSASGSKSNAVEICHGSRMVMDSCEVTSAFGLGAAIYVWGVGTCPEVRNCIIKDCENVGLYVTDQATGTYLENDISNNALAGVWVRNNANPVMRKCCVHHGRDVGIFIFDSGCGMFESCDIHDNRIAGFELKAFANPTVCRCRIHHGQTGGVYVHEEGRGQFLDNDIFQNNFAGVWITSSSHPTIRNNHIHSGNQGGVYIFGEGRGLIENNDIHGNQLAGIQIRSGSEPIIRNNFIHDGEHGGIYVHERGKGLIEGNEVYANKLAGVWITTDSSPTLRRNKIHDGRQVGVYFYDNGHGILEDNDIFDHLYSGVQIRTGSNPVVRRNKIWGGQNGGVLVYNGGFGTLEENEIFDNAMAGVWIKTNSNPFLTRNKIYDGRDGGVCIFNNGYGVLKENEIFRNRQAGILVSSGSRPILRDNIIFDGHAAGLEITNDATAVLNNNVVFNNRFYGIALASNINPPVLTGNQVYGNHDLVEKTIQAGKCLYKISSSTSFPMHDFYRCKTCLTNDRNSICVNCIEKCHIGHEVEYVRKDRFFCDCGARAFSESTCKLLDLDDRENDFDNISPSKEAGALPYQNLQ